MTAAIRDRWRYPAIGILSFFTLWPFTRVNPIADDLHLLAQGSGLLRQEGLAAVLGKWAEFDFSSAHLTPVGGVLTALHVWIANQLALRTPMTIDDSWGLLRVVWIVVAVVVATWCCQRLLRLAGFSSLGPWTTALALVASLQVHAYWSNDPVIAFPVASWAFCIIGLVYLCMSIESLLVHTSRVVLWRVGAVLTACVGILTYELFIAFLAANVILQVGLVLCRVRRAREVMPVLILGGLLPGVLLVISQMVRLLQGSSYTGTDVAMGTEGIIRIGLVAALSSLPLAATRLTLTVLPQHAIDKAMMLMSVSGIVLMALLASRSRHSATELSLGQRRAALPVMAALATLWITSTLVIIATPKYQGELSGVLGRVYINYAPSWLAIGLLMVLIVGQLARRYGSFGLQVSICALVALGMFQSWANIAQVTILARDSSWSTRLLQNLESTPENAVQRCRDVEFLFSLPLPEYYQLEVFDGLQRSYAGTWGLPYCDFGANGPVVHPVTRSVIGTYPVEHLPDSRRIVWTNSPEVQLQVINASDTILKGNLSMTVSLPPCASERTVSLTDSTLTFEDGLRTLTLSRENPSARAGQTVSLAPGESTYVGFTQSGSGCQVGEDPRSFWTMVDLPSVTPG